jgi:hypothetical protein
MMKLIMQSEYGEKRGSNILMILGSTTILEMNSVKPIEMRKPEIKTKISHRSHNALLNTQADVKRRMVKLYNA